MIGDGKITLTKADNGYIVTYTEAMPMTEQEVADNPMLEAMSQMTKTTTLTKYREVTRLFMHRAELVTWLSAHLSLTEL